MVHKTKDYDKFGFNYLNREVDAAHVRRLVKDMKEAGLRVRIIVDENKGLFLKPNQSDSLHQKIVQKERNALI